MKKSIYVICILIYLCMAPAEAEDLTDTKASYEAFQLAAVINKGVYTGASSVLSAPFEEEGVPNETINIFWGELSQRGSKQMAEIYTNELSYDDISQSIQFFRSPAGQGFLGAFFAEAGSIKKDFSDEESATLQAKLCINLKQRLAQEPDLEDLSREAPDCPEIQKTDQISYESIQLVELVAYGMEDAVEKFISNMPGSPLSGDDFPKNAVPESVQKHVVKILKEVTISTAADYFKEKMASAYMAHLSPEQIRQAISFFRSQTGQKYIRIQSTYSAYNQDDNFDEMAKSACSRTENRLLKEIRAPQEDVSRFKRVCLKLTNSISDRSKGVNASSTSNNRSVQPNTSSMDAAFEVAEVAAEKQRKTIALFKLGDATDVVLKHLSGSNCAEKSGGITQCIGIFGYQPGQPLTTNVVLKEGSLVDVEIVSKDSAQCAILLENARSLNGNELTRSVKFNSDSGANMWAHSHVWGDVYYHNWYLFVSCDDNGGFAKLLSSESPSWAMMKAATAQQFLDASKKRGRR